MSDYFNDPRDYGYERVAEGYYLKETYMHEAGKNVWQVLVVPWGPHGIEPYVLRSEALAFLDGVREAREERNNV